MQTVFEQALKRWIATLNRYEELLSRSTPSPRSEDDWEKADFDQEDAQAAVKIAKKEYEGAVRKADFGF